MCRDSRIKQGSLHRLQVINMRLEDFKVGRYVLDIKYNLLYEVVDFDAAHDLVELYSEHAHVTSLISIKDKKLYPDNDIIDYHHNMINKRHSIDITHNKGILLLPGS